MEIHPPYLCCPNSIFRSLMPRHMLKVGFHNAGSLNTNHDEFIVALIDHDLDILAVNETWLRRGEENRASIVPGYRLKHIPRSDKIKNGRGGGVGFYARQGIPFKPIQLTPVQESVEQMWLSLVVNTRKIAFGTAYRPPWQDVDVFLDSLTHTISSLSDFDSLVLLGDFNVNLLNNNDIKTDKMKDFFHICSLDQLISEPTHFTDHSKTLIDIICMHNLASKCVQVDRIVDLNSHAFLSCEINCRRPKVPANIVTVRPFKDIDDSLFESDLIRIRDAIFNSEDINVCLNKFNSVILTLFDLHAPLKIIKCKTYSYPWITDNIRLMMKLRKLTNDMLLVRLRVV